ncbi:MAG: hypothetical protein LC135_07325 [Phycisphaerae bacterium]|nr:hypothetical protein [Phycisphaerae bacterium]MCZ2399663.1 hypothetical protein [Phycisphaerae bacterium]NUQ50862.1 hypothetical protein [Phycisphaerae bacterium]
MAAAQEQAAPAPKRVRLPKTTLIVVVVTVVEAAVFVGLFMMFSGGPQPSYGHGEQHVTEGPDPTVTAPTVEIPLLQKFRVPNNIQGVTWIYDLDLVVKVPAHLAEEMERIKAARLNEIQDSVAGIVRRLDPRYLNEPDLRTLRFQVERVLTEISGNSDLIEAVLIPRCVPIRAG